MLAEDDAGFGAQRHGRLEVAADGEDARRNALRDNRRRVAARAPQHHRPPGNDADDGIVHRPHDRPVMNQEQIGDAAEAPDGLMLVDADRLVRTVAAGGDHRESGFGQQQMVQRRVGKHDADERIAGRNAVGERAPVLPQQHDRPLG